MPLEGSGWLNLADPNVAGNQFSWEVKISKSLLYDNKPRKLNETNMFSSG